jgi:nucleoside-diphosphate-sugar epimerase
VDECLEATLRLMHSDFTGPVNIGSEEMVSINQFVEMIAKIAGKTININHITGPVGVRGRNSDNTLYNQKLGWKVSQPLSIGLEKTYQWICKQAANNNS